VAAGRLASSPTLVARDSGERARSLLNGPHASSCGLESDGPLQESATLAALGGDQPQRPPPGRPFERVGLSAKEHNPRPRGGTRRLIYYRRQLGCSRAAAGGEHLSRSLALSEPCKPQALGAQRAGGPWRSVRLKRGMPRQPGQVHDGGTSRPSIQATAWAAPWQLRRRVTRPADPWSNDPRQPVALDLAIDIAAQERQAARRAELHVETARAVMSAGTVEVSGLEWCGWSRRPALVPPGAAPGPAGPGPGGSAWIWPTATGAGAG